MIICYITLLSLLVYAKLLVAIDRYTLILLKYFNKRLGDYTLKLKMGDFLYCI